MKALSFKQHLALYVSIAIVLLVGAGVMFYYGVVMFRSMLEKANAYGATVGVVRVHRVH